MEQLYPIMLAGTGSDVGKSVITAGLCRIFRQDGFHPAPFKAQNMALNSFATPDGLEIGRAQAVQADAAGIACSTDMNPILLKPTADMTSQVVLNGRPIGNSKAMDYFSARGREFLRNEVHSAFDRLSKKFNPIVMEGAGSIAEINLADVDLVNMPMARYADARVIIVADIDRGGVFASVYGSVMLQSPDDRRRIKGIIINKFRGDIRLFEKGKKMLEELCGVPVLGIVPYTRDIHIEEEDSVCVEMKNRHPVEGKINIAVILLSHMSNFTDFDALGKVPEVNIFFTDNPREIENSQIIIIPGSKSTIDDLEKIRKNGIADAILRACGNGKTVVGICGGYQMMGVNIHDPECIEGEINCYPGLGLLPVETTITPEKTTCQTNFRFIGEKEKCSGYEIHMGKTISVKGVAYSPLVEKENGETDGYYINEKCFGTYIHGIFDNRAAICHLLRPYSIGEQLLESLTDYKEYKERQYDSLADMLRKNLDIEAIYRIMRH